MSETLINDAIDAWVKDTGVLDSDSWEHPLLQTEVIPLACTWSLARAKLGLEPTTIFEFAQDVMNHPEARATWESRAKAAGDMMLRSLDEIHYTQHMQDLKKQTGSPYAFIVFALEDGRPLQDRISTLEVSLLRNLGHAAYNSSGNSSTLLRLHPLGPPKDNPRGFLIVSRDNVREFVEENFND